MSSYLRRIERRILVEKGKMIRLTQQPEQQHTEKHPALTHRQAQRGKRYS